MRVRKKVFTFQLNDVCNSIRILRVASILYVWAGFLVLSIHGVYLTINSYNIFQYVQYTANALLLASTY